jgi:2-phospho-L-lactate guanylyltransferase
MCNPVAIVPVAPLRRAKTRLSSLLSQPERSKLVLCMLTDVTSALKATGLILNTTVVTSDEKVAKLAASLGVNSLTEPNPPELNAALNLATSRLLNDVQDGASLIIPVDIPMVDSSSLVAAIRLADESSNPIVVATASNNGGTNFLLRVPSDIISPAFGQDSFATHRREALSKGICFREYESRNISLDIDTADDLYEFMDIGKHTNTWDYLKNEIRLPERTSK